jgi:hypothetical protein
MSDSQYNMSRMLYAWMFILFRVLLHTYIHVLVQIYFLSMCGTSQLGIWPR